MENGPQSRPVVPIVFARPLTRALVYILQANAILVSQVKCVTLPVPRDQCFLDHLNCCVSPMVNGTPGYPIAGQRIALLYRLPPMDRYQVRVGRDPWDKSVISFVRLALI